MILYCLPLFFILQFLNGDFNFENETVSPTQAEIAYLKDFYIERHKNPEISLEEKETSAALASALRESGYTVNENIGGYGIVGILKNGEGPQILYRSDMDALPMYEKTGLDYASNVTTQYNGAEVGAMHSCGHDMHMTSLVGTARAMAAIKEQWKGTLMFIGQPAEEIGAGAKAMLDDGLYARFGVPDFGLALHCSPTILSGQIGVAPGYTMANTESIDITVYGIGAHGATPHMSIDPVVLASMIVMELQTIVSRNVSPIDAAVVTVGAIKGGTKHNIIPDEVGLQLTVRTFKEDVRLFIHKRIREICRGMAIAAGLPEDKFPKVEIPESFTPANFNEPTITAAFRSSATQILGDQNVLLTEPMTVGEDFSRYGSTPEKVPTVLYWLGTITQEKVDRGQLPGLHSPYYYPEIEKTVETAVKVNVRVLVDLFNQKG